MSSERILIVEDSPTAMLQITTILQEKGYKLLHAVDGEEALQKAADELPHLIVLDVILPKKNGFQVCRHLKKTTQTQDIKILMLTSKTQESDRFWGLKQGADDYMTKPFEPGDLLQKVDELLH
jgi:twitching motility two-component system response regulator PilH